MFHFHNSRKANFLHLYMVKHLKAQTYYDNDILIYIWSHKTDFFVLGSKFFLLIWISSKYMDWFEKIFKSFDVLKNMESLYGLHVISEGKWHIWSCFKIFGHVFDYRKVWVKTANIDKSPNRLPGYRKQLTSLCSSDKLAIWFG